jgi:hypothetical protein
MHYLLPFLICIKHQDGSNVQSANNEETCDVMTVMCLNDTFFTQNLGVKLMKLNP